MLDSQLAQLKSMSPAGRISHYLKKKISGEITSQKYDECIAFALSLENPPVNEEGGTVGADHGASPEAVECEGNTNVVSSDTRYVQTRRDAHSDTQSTQVEFVDSFPLPLDSDGTVRPKPDPSVENQSNSQKARLLTLLSDYEWHDTPNIQVAVYGANHLGIARVAARVNDLKNDGHDIESRKITQAIWSYRLVEKGMRWISENIMAG